MNQDCTSKAWRTRFLVVGHGLARKGKIEYCRSWLLIRAPLILTLSVYLRQASPDPEEPSGVWFKRKACSERQPHVIHQFNSTMDILLCHLYNASSLSWTAPP